LREAVGLRRFQPLKARPREGRQEAKAALPVFKQYRETDGQFYFKLSAPMAACCCRARALPAAARRVTGSRS
jgi:hypothetical protein